MSEQVPTKDEVWSDARICDELGDYDPGLSDQHIEQVFKQARALIRRQRGALRGISSCSTCEACRGAATLVLTNGNQAVASSSGDVVVAPMPRGSLPNSLGVSNDGFSAIAEAVSKADPANYRAQPPGDVT